jgi:hypothetical protein
MSNDALDLYCPHCHVPIRLTVERTDAPVPVTWTCPRCKKESTYNLSGEVVRVQVTYEAR